MTLSFPSSYYELYLRESSVRTKKKVRVKNVYIYTYIEGSCNFVHPGTNSWQGFLSYLFIFKLKFKSENVVKKQWMNKFIGIKIWSQAFWLIVNLIWRIWQWGLRLPSGYMEDSFHRLIKLDMSFKGLDKDTFKLVIRQNNLLLKNKEVYLNSHYVYFFNIFWIY